MTPRLAVIAKHLSVLLVAPAHPRRLVVCGVECGKWSANRNGARGQQQTAELSASALLCSRGRPRALAPLSLTVPSPPPPPLAAPVTLRSAAPLTAQNSPGPQRYPSAAVRRCASPFDQRRRYPSPRWRVDPLRSRAEQSRQTAGRLRLAAPPGLGRSGGEQSSGEVPRRVDSSPSPSLPHSMLARPTCRDRVVSARGGDRRRLLRCALSPPLPPRARRL